MKLKSLLFIAAAGIGCAAFATNYTWNGGEGNWTDTTKWTPSGYPQTSSDAVIFDRGGTVSLNTGVQTDIAYIKVTAGDVVLTATEGSALKINWPGYNNPSGVTGDRGIMVSEGASLDLAAPLATMSGRFDRQGEGALTMRDIAIRKENSTNMYFFNGTNSFVGTSSLTLPTASVTFGVGAPYGPMPIFIRDQAALCPFGLFPLAGRAAYFLDPGLGHRGPGQRTGLSSFRAVLPGEAGAGGPLVRRAAAGTDPAHGYV